MGRSRAARAGALQDASARCWGFNGEGRLGDATLTMRSTLVEVMDLSDIAIRQDASIWCWGLNAKGQLGDGSTAHQYNPVAVQGL